MNFWLSAALLTGVIALICFYPLLRSHFKQEQGKREQLNKALYFDRLKEIAQDEQRGLLTDVNQFTNELQQSLLDDIPEQKQVVNQQKSYNKIWFATATLSLAIVATVAYFKVGAWQAELMLAKTYEKLPQFYQRLQEEETNPLSETEMQQFATALRQALQKEPKNAKNWWLLGQLGMAMDNAQLAYDSYAKASELMPENTEYKLAYARMLMFSQDSSDKLKGEELLKQVMRVDHSNLQALSLLAFHYFEKEDYKMALVSWAMMLKLMSEDDPKRALIEKSIRAARDALAEQEEEKHKIMTPDK